MSDSVYYRFNKESSKNQSSQRNLRYQERAKMSHGNTSGDSNTNSSDSEKDQQINALVLKAAELESKLKTAEQSNAILSEQLNERKNKPLDQPKFPDLTELDGKALKSILDYVRQHQEFTQANFERQLQRQQDQLKDQLDQLNHRLGKQEEDFSRKLNNAYKDYSQREDEKIKFATKPPQLSGLDDDYFSWYISFMNILEASRIPKSKWVSALGVVVKNNALFVFNALKTEYPNANWDTFEPLFRNKFVLESNSMNSRKKLRDLRQEHNKFNEFINKFNSLIIQVEDCSEQEKIATFTNCLLPKTMNHVCLKNPKTLTEAIENASRFELYNSKPNQSNNKQAFYGKNNNVRCYNCKQLGHIAKNCRTQDENSDSEEDMQEQNENSDNSSNDDSKSERSIQSNIYTKNSHAKYASYSKKDDSERIRNEYSMLASECKLTTIEGKLNNTQVNCIFDTGASTSILSEFTARKLNINFNKCERMFTLANGDIFKPIGISEDCEINIFNLKLKLKFIITKFLDKDVILGLDWFNQSGACLDPKNKKIYIPLEKDIYKSSGRMSEQNYNYAEVKSLIENDCDVCFKSENFNIINSILNFDKFSETDKNTILSLAKIINNIIASNCKTLELKEESFSAKNKETNCLYEETERLVKIFNKPEAKKELKAGIVNTFHNLCSVQDKLEPIIRLAMPKRLSVDFKKLDFMRISDYCPIESIDELLNKSRGSIHLIKSDFRSGFEQIETDKLYVLETVPEKQNNNPIPELRLPDSNRKIFLYKNASFNLNYAVIAQKYIFLKQESNKQHEWNYFIKTKFRKNINNIDINFYFNASVFFKNLLTFICLFIFISANRILVFENKFKYCIFNDDKHTLDTKLALRNCISNELDGKSSIKNDEAYPIMDKKEKLMFQKLKSTSGKPEQTYGVIVNAKILREEKSRIEDNSEARSGGSVDGDDL